MNASAPRTSTNHRLITTRPFLKHIHSYNSPLTDESPFHSIALLNLEKDNPRSLEQRLNARIGP